MSKHELTELPTGERVISEHVPSVRSVALGFWVRAGSRDEPNSRAGVSHFIEHLLFKGSSRYSAQEIAEFFDELGGELNAATSRETTIVYARVPDDKLEPALDVMTDMLYRPSFDDVDSEREVILEEIAMVEDTPHDVVHDIASQTVFGEHPLGRPVIGRAEVISTVSRRALASYHRRAYAADRLVLAAAGNLKHAELVELLRARTGAPPDGTLPARRPVRRLPPPGLRFQRKDTEQYHVCLSAPGMARTDERRFAASVLDAIVGGSASSRLFQEIREKRGMAYAVYTFSSQYSDSGPHRALRRHPRGESRDLPGDRGRGARGPGRGQRPPRGARAGEGESQGAAAPLARVDVEPHDAPRAGDRDRHAAPLGRRDRPAARRRDAGGGLRAGAWASRRRAALGRRDRPRRGCVSRRGRAHQPLAARGGGVRVAFFGASGKVGAIVAPAIESAGHEIVDARNGDVERL